MIDYIVGIGFIVIGINMFLGVIADRNMRLRIEELENKVGKDKK